MKRTIYFSIFILLGLSLGWYVTSKPEPIRFPDDSTNYCQDISFEKNSNIIDQLVPFQPYIANGKTGVYVLEQNTEAMFSRAWLSENAEKSIDVQYFIFSTDNIGLLAIDYLVRAAERGVKVRILVDDIMLDAKGDELLTLDAHPNITIKVYNPLANVGKNLAQKLVNLTTQFHAFNQRMHNKTFTVDNLISITGGRNVADEYFGYDHQYNFRDRDVLLLGKTVNTIQNSFDKFWQNELSVDVTKLFPDQAGIIKQQRNKPDFDKLHQYACNPENFLPEVRAQIKAMPQAFKLAAQQGDLHWLNDVEYVSDDPGKNNGEKFLSGSGIATERLIELVQTAKKSITIQTPYLITTDLGKGIFKQLTERGVEIKILTNSLASNDNLDAFSGYQRDRSALLETGVNIFEFKPDAQIRQKIMSNELSQKLTSAPIFALHAKSMVIDEKIAVIGTFNLDPRSANLNTESVTIINSTNIAQKMKAAMLVEMQPENAWEISPSWNPDGEVDLSKRIKVKTRLIVPKSIL